MSLNTSFSEAHSAVSSSVPAPRMTLSTCLRKALYARVASVSCFGIGSFRIALMVVLLFLVGMRLVGSLGAELLRADRPRSVGDVQGRHVHGDAGLHPLSVDAELRGAAADGRVGCAVRDELGRRVLGAAARPDERHHD